MTTILQARTALITAVGAVDDVIDPPAVYVTSRGSDLTSLGGGGIDWGFTVTCVVPYQGDYGTAETALVTALSGKLIIVRTLAGWRVDGVGPSQMRIYAGGELLAADINVTFRVHI